jgi:hypothetical protein
MIACHSLYPPGPSTMPQSNMVKRNGDPEPILNGNNNMSSNATDEQMFYWSWQGLRRKPSGTGVRALASDISLRRAVTHVTLLWNIVVHDC